MTICIPQAPGVPGFVGQPPYWLPGGPFLQYTKLDDPRWRGSFAQGFPLLNGTVEQVSFRALYHSEASGGGSVTYLDLSWYIKVDLGLHDLQDRLYVGLGTSAGSDAIAIAVTVYSSPTAAEDQPPAGLAVKQWNSTTSTWNDVTPNPTWLGDTKVWLSFDPMTLTGVQWAVQMRVPVTTSATFLDPTNGLSLPADFRLWYFVRDQAPGMSGAIVKYEWLPGGVPSTATAITAGNYPAPTTWDTAHRSTGPTDPLCASGGIALQYYDVGTENAVSSEIKYRTTGPVASRPANTFFVKPRNYSAAMIPASTSGAERLRARIRVANWGSAVGPTFDWRDIPLVPVGSPPLPPPPPPQVLPAIVNTVDIPPIAAGSSPPAVAPIRADWRLSNNDISTFLPAGATNHKCILVELTGPGVTFLNNSTWHNMDFVPASIFRRDCEISIRGLTLISAAPRDVYLFVETRNMPARIDSTRPTPPPRQPEPGPPASVGSRGGDTPGELPKGPPTFEEQVANLPTYRVHVYHDLGETDTVGGVTVPVLEPQSSFGYYLQHAGALAGWRHAIHAPPAAQLQQVGPDFYKIVVPNNGSVSIVTAIQAIEPGLTGQIQGCLAVPVTIVLAIVQGIARALQAVRDWLVP